jgi:cytochrome c-type biogenesis protein CcmH/NrfG
MANERELTADELAALGDERDFLLRSLDDLEEEHAAGDVDDHDYATLRDDYTARAARVIRTIEKHQAREAVPEPTSIRWRRVAAAVGVVVFALGCGALVADAAGRRGGGDTVTGSIRQTNRSKIDEAFGLAQSRHYDQAIGVLDDVLDTSPDNVEAMTFKGWFQYLAGNGGDGLTTLISAAELDGTYPATHAFLATILTRAGETDYAQRELAILDGLDPPPDILQLVEPLRAELDQPAGSPGSTTTVPPSTP